MAYGKKLTDAEVKVRMVELRNLRKLHTNDRHQIRELKAENIALRALVDQQQATIETLKIQVAELQTMVFGKRQKPPTGHYEPELVKPDTPTRGKTSYRRPLPPASAVTATKPMPLPAVCTCGGTFKDITVHDRYEEDIPLPDLTKDYRALLVTKYQIERGICRKCGKAATGKSWHLGGQTVTLGPNVRLLMAHLVSVVGLSYTQVANLLLGLYGLKVSDGEIAASLSQRHKAWLPAYNQLKADIRAAPVRHYDETPWAIQDQKGSGYAWVMSDDRTYKTLFQLATSRGAPHAQRLHGKTRFNGVFITDDYQAYRNLSGQQQLCWVHLYRVIRDLRYNSNLPKEQLAYVTQWYEAFAAIYGDLRQYLDEPYDNVVRQTQADKLWRRLQSLAKQPSPSSGEPDKLARLKAQLLRRGQAKLFTCLIRDTPCDNNRAERDLRQLVLKRKRSFGSKTRQGAQALATVLSVCTTTWRANQTGYFKALAELG